MVHTVQPTDITERLRSLSAEPVPDRDGGAPANKRPVAWWLFAVLLTGAVIGSAGYLLITKTPPPPLPEQAARPDEPLPKTAPVRPVSAPDGMSVIGSGYSRAERDVVLTASAGGRVAGIMTGEGVDVAAGTVLLQLDDRLAREELRRTDLTLKAKRLDRQQAELALSRQRGDTARIGKLAEKGVIPRQKAREADHALAQRELDLARAEAGMVLAAADRDAARSQLEDYVLKAPFDGRISELTAQPGQLVRNNPGEALLRLFDPDSIIVDVDVDDRNLRAIRAGLPAELVFDAWSNVKIPGRVIRVAPLVSKERGTVRVTIALEAAPAGLRPNMSVRATINTASEHVQLSFNQEISDE